MELTFEQKEQTREKIKSTQHFAGDRFFNMFDHMQYVLIHVKNQYSLISVESGQTWAGISKDKLKAFGNSGQFIKIRTER